MKQSRSETIGSEISAPRGMVTAMHPAAATTAVQVLDEGGSAHDAAVAALAMLAVTEPFMSGPGGHGAALVAEPGRVPYVVDGSARGPRGAVAGEPPLRGAGAVPVPAAVAAWSGLHTAGGTQSMAELLEPAIRSARQGLPVAWYTALMIASHARLLSEDRAAAAVFLDDHGFPPRAATSSSERSDLHVNRDLAETLSRLAVHGLDEFRVGVTARRIAETAGKDGGALALEDLERLSEPKPRPALEGKFRGWTVYAGPEASAATSLLEMLALLEDLDPQEVPLGGSDYYALMADVQRAAFLDRDWHGDPEFVDTPLAAYGDPELARLRREDLQLAHGGPLPVRDLGQEGYPVVSRSQASLSGSSRDGTSTTHLNIAAPDGTLISATFTLGFPFGAGIVAAETGLLLGNTLHQFHPEAGHPNSVAAGKCAVWNGAPTILSKDGRPRIAVGAPGGPRIPGAIAQVLVAHLVYGLSPQRATEVPRIFQQADVAYIDDRVASEVVDELAKAGRRVEAIPEGPFVSNFGRPGIISINDEGTMHGGVDSSRLGTVVGW
jgi:gamma-glutamyltranspeptidase/glutathione hydrolase